MLQKAIIAATEHLRGLYELSGGVEQDGEKGAFREFFVSQLIRPFMPPHFGIGSGVVMDYYERQSRQSDVIIYDRRLLPPILLAGDRGIFPIDSVLAVIEVKSCLKASYYRSIVDAARRISPHDDNNNPQSLLIHIPGNIVEGNGPPRAIYPCYAVFAYTSDAHDKDEISRLVEQVPDSRDFIRLICVLDKDIWSFQESKGGYHKHTGVTCENIGIWFLRLLLDRLEEVAKTRGDYRLRDWLPL